MQCFVRKLQTQDKKIMKELQGTRDLHYLPAVKEFDLKQVHTYLLTSVPLTFAHIYGGVKHLSIFPAFSN